MLDVEIHNVVLMQIIYVAQSMWSCTPLALMALQETLCGPINFQMLRISIRINYHGYECLWIDVAGCNVLRVAPRSGWCPAPK